MPLIALRKLRSGSGRRAGFTGRDSAGGPLLLLSTALLWLGACASDGSDVLESGATAASDAGAMAHGSAGVTSAGTRAVAVGGGPSAAGSGGTSASSPRAGAGMQSAVAGAAGGATMAAGSGGVAAASGGASGSVAVAGAGGTPSMSAAGAAAPSSDMSAAGTGGAAAVSGNVTIWLAGDSTVAKGETPCPVGWGAEFQPLFKPEAKVVNSAVGGRSVRTWLYEVQTTMDSSGECALNKDSSGEPVLQARWQMMLDAMSGMRPGDYLFIQFGINDSSATCDRHVGLDAFKESYGMMADAAKKRGAQPIFVTPVSAISCQGSTAKPTRGSFVTATTDAGKQYDVPVIDLHARSIDLYNKQGLCPIPGGSDVSASTGGKTGAFFCDDHTHFADEGAQQIAKLVADALRDQSIGLAAYLK